MDNVHPLVRKYQARIRFTSRVSDVYYNISPRFFGFFICFVFFFLFFFVVVVVVVVTDKLTFTFYKRYGSSLLKQYKITNISV